MAKQDIPALDHVGLCVHDIEAATAFLTAALGVELTSESLGPNDEQQSGTEAEQRFGLAPGARIAAIRMLRFRRGAGIELFQMTAPEQREPSRASDLGWQHVAVRTDDLEAALLRFTQAGGELLAAPPIDKEGRAYRYARTPFGVLVEFVQLDDVAEA